MPQSKPVFRVYTEQRDLAAVSLCFEGFRCPIINEFLEETRSRSLVYINLRKLKKIVVMPAQRKRPLKLSASCLPRSHRH